MNLIEGGRRAQAQLAAALAQIGATTKAPNANQRDLLVVDLEGRALVLETRYVAYATADRVRGVLASRTPSDVRRVLVAGRITADARSLLTDAGWSWLDLRGRLHLRAPGVLVDTDVDAARPESSSARRGGIVGRSGIAVAYWLCAHPGRAPSPTKDGPQLGLAPSTVTGAMQHLATGGLVDDDGGAFPELFWELAARWEPMTVWLASVPDLKNDANTTEWRAGGNAAAAAYGAPLVTRGDGPVELYAAGPVELDIASRRYGAAPAGAGAAVVRSAPLDAARVGYDDTPGPKIRGIGRPVVPLLTVALDIARDRGRGHQVLDEWNPPGRVW